MRRRYRLDNRCGRAVHQRTWWVETDASGLTVEGTRGTWTYANGRTREEKHRLTLGKCCVLVEVSEVTAEG